MNEMMIGSTKIFYQTKTSPNRKKIELTVNEKGLIVNLPINNDLSKEEIEVLINKNAEKILTKMIRLENVHPNKTIIIKNKGKLPFKGEEYEIIIKKSEIKRIKIQLINDRINISIPNNTNSNKLISNAINKWYKEQANDYFITRVNIISNTLELYPNKIIVRQFKSRWGTCYEDNSIAFNWRLIIAPSWVQDYIFNHEILHIKYKSHSVKYKTELTNAYNKSNDAKEWLKNHRGYLYFNFDVVI